MEYANMLYMLYDGKCICNLHLFCHFVLPPVYPCLYSSVIYLAVSYMLIHIMSYCTIQSPRLAAAYDTVF